MSTVSKSYRSEDPISNYCTDLSLRQHPLQVKLQEKTLAEAGRWAGMLGAPEVLHLGHNFIQLIGGKRALDVGTFTGASALAWALALPADGQVITMDVSHESYDKIGRQIIESDPSIAKKIDFRLGSAIDTLDSLIAKGESGKFDFAFIDADKTNYVNYYNKCIQLLRSGGVIIIDNALWSGSVTREPKSEDTKTIDAVNRLAHSDQRVNNSLINLGDGTHIIFKK